MATPKKTENKTAKKKPEAKANGGHSTHAINPHVAHSAAAALLARAKAGSQAKTTAAQAESAAFKALKQGVGQTQHSATSPLSGANKFTPGGQQSGANRQVGHTQNSSANFNRVGVPRRTSGG